MYILHQIISKQDITHENQNQIEMKEKGKKSSINGQLEKPMNLLQHVEEKITMHDVTDYTILYLQKTNYTNK